MDYAKNSAADFTSNKDYTFEDTPKQQKPFAKDSKLSAEIQI